MRFSSGAERGFKGIGSMYRLLFMIVEWFTIVLSIETCFAFIFVINGKQFLILYCI